jgi:DNA-binding NarL/FixJ family response regulator
LNAVVTLVVADQQQFFAEGLATILDAEDDFAVVGVAHNGRRAVELAADHRPTVLLLDPHLPDADLGATLTAVRVAGDQGGAAGRRRRWEDHRGRDRLRC